MSADNSPQITYWNEQAGLTWATEADVLDAQLAPLTAVALERAAARPGERVADVGCGCGATTVALARAVGPEGSVLGLDVSAPMLERARRRAAAAGLSNVTFVTADAQTYRPPAPVDLAFSRFGVMFFADPVAAFAALRAGLAPGGRLTFLCWRSLRENPWAALPGKALVTLLPEKPPTPDPEAPGPFALADGDRVRALLEAAGFGTVSVDPLDDELQIGGSAGLDEAVRLSLVIGPAARLLAGVDERTRARAPEVIREVLAPFAGPDGVRMTAAAWLVTARP